MPGQQPDPNAELQNALMLQAIKGGAMGGAQAPAAATSAAMGPPPTGMPSPMASPVDPSTMQGGMGMQNQMAAMPQMNQAMMQQQNPVASALMSPIPGGQ
jgi:hypothetical protein